MTSKIRDTRPWADKLTDGFLTDHTDDAYDWTRCAVGEFLGFPKDENTVTDFLFGHDTKGYIVKRAGDFSAAVEHDDHDVAWDAYDDLKGLITPAIRDNFRAYVALGDQVKKQVADGIKRTTQ